MLPALRAGLPADALALARLYRASRAAAMPWLREPYTEGECADWLRGTLIARHRVLVAEAVDGPAGYVGFGDQPQHGPMVLHLYLAPARRRQGIGSLLLNAATVVLGPRVSLFCFAANTAARRFYEAHGFRAVTEGDGSGNEEGAPDILYRRAAGDLLDQPMTGELQ